MARAVQTRAALVESAERLFAERGIEAVSLRDVSAAAGQRNHSAAQYHFGDRAGLLAAVFEYRMHQVNERRHAKLAALEGDGNILEIVEAVVEPLVTIVAESNSSYGRFLARTRWDNFAQGVVAELPVLSSYMRACRLLVGSMQGLPPRLRVSRLDQMGTLLVGTVGGWEGQRELRRRVLSPQMLGDDLVVTITAILQAPLGRRTSKDAIADHR